MLFRVISKLNISDTRKYSVSSSQKKNKNKNETPYKRVDTFP